MQKINDKRTYLERDAKTKEEFEFPLNYTIHLEQGKVVDVINQSGYPVEHRSEVFEFYSNKFNNI